MTTRAELEQITELKAAQAMAERLNQVSRDLNAAADEDEMLQALLRPVAESGVKAADLMYIDLDQAGEPEWIELVATWQAEGPPSVPVGSRFYVPQFPFTHLWMANPDEPQLVSDVLTDERIDKNTKNVLIQADSQAMAVIPLIQAGRWVGLISMTWRKAHTFSPQESKILHALSSLASPVVENRRLLNRTRETLGELRRLKMAVEQSIDGIAISDLDGNIQFANTAWAQMHGYSVEELPGQHLSMFHTEEQLQEDVIPFNQQVIKTGAHQGQVGHVRRDGSTFPTWMSSTMLKDEAENPVGLVGTARDITAQKEAEAEHERLQQEVIEAQQRTLQELSTPIIPVMERIIVMPIVGSIDSLRAKDIMRTLLAGIRAHRAQVVILDITGVPIVDSGVASHLDKTIQAARLKGAQTIITGISDAVAEAVVDLGLDWSNVETLSDLQTGLVTALKRLGIELSKGQG
jgi:PAS domain S-box-containing protein